MNLRISLIAFFLLGIGIFSDAQDKKSTPSHTKPKIENGADAIPITVTSSKKQKKPTPPKAPAPVKFTAPVIVKDGPKGTPPPPPPPLKKSKTANLPAPPPPPVSPKEED